MIKNFVKTDQADTTSCRDPIQVLSCRGFTLLELSIVLIITGILTIPLVRLYTDYLQQEKIDLTKSNLDHISRVVALSSPLRYPCPADRSLIPGDINYGVDVCTIPGFSLNAIPVCDVTGAEQGICKTAGARDTDYDTDAIPGNNQEVVLIGAVPVASLNAASTALSLDAWNNQFTYAVSYPSTAPTTGFTRFKNGVIRILDEWGNPTIGVNNDAQFVIISHGHEGDGAYNNRGVKAGCNVANILGDGENCNGDNTFIQGLAHYEGTKQYNDYSYVQTDQSANLWQVITDPGNLNAPTSHITTIPNGSIGIKTTAPGQNEPANIDVRVDVNGNLRADTVRTPEICSRDGSQCLEIGSANDFFGSRKESGAVTNDCPDGEVILSIGNKRVTCSKADIKFKGAQILCPVGSWVQEVFTDGSIKCQNSLDPTNVTICPGGTGCL